MIDTDQHLDEVLILQLTWKPSIITDVAVRIIALAMAHGYIWPDEIKLDGIAEEDRNCIGTAFRLLAGPRTGILRMSGEHRRSTRPQSAGRRIFRYDLADHKRAAAFLSRNTIRQPELFPHA